MGDGLPITDHRSPITGVSLLTVVMHELGHLLGYEHSDAPDDLMAPVLSPPSPRSSSLISHRSSRLDEMFAEWGDNSRNSDSESPLVVAKDGDLLTGVGVPSSEEATQAKVPRRSRLQRYERELDDWFAGLAADEGSAER